MALRLLVTVGPDLGKTFDLEPGKSYVLGRGDDCDIQLSDARISRNHCRISAEGGRANVEDLASSWGTLLNGNRVETSPIQPNDVITLVETQLRIEVMASATAATWKPDSESPPPVAKPVKPESTVSPETNSGTSSALDSLVGRTLHRFAIQSIIARTKSGILFRGQDTKHQRPVALKVLWPEFSQQEEDMQRFVRAIKSMAAIRHPNLVRVYGAGKAGAFCWTASEFLNAESLATRIAQSEDSRLPWKTVLQIAVDITRGLQAAAEHHVVHRNITPQNILVDRTDRSAKLGDLMLAKALEGGQAEKITRPGETVGELPFLAPEQLLNPQSIDSRADIYSLGATLYTALTGRPPFRGNTLSETLRDIQSADPVKPTNFHPSIPVELESIVLRMLAKSPAQRFGSANELLTELETLARIHGLIQETPTPPPKKSVPVAPLASPPPPVAKPVFQPDTGIPSFAVEEQSISSRLKSKPTRSTNRNSTVIYAGGAAGALLLLLGTLWAMGVFSSDQKTAPKVAKTKDAKTGEDKTDKEESPAEAQEPEPVASGPMELPELIKKVEPSIVRIDVSSLEGESSGSGFVVGSEGIVITNYHVIEGAERATAVFADGKNVRVTGIWHADPKTDIAIIQLNAFGVKLPPLPLSETLPPKGESVVAFGAPLGFDFTASQGIVSGIRQAGELANVGIEDHLGTWIQTTAPISPGNSGGPLVDRLGKVVAVNTLTHTLGQNLNLAISATDVWSAVKRRSSEAEPLREWSQKTLAAEFGLDAGSEITPADVEIDPATREKIAELMGQGKKSLKNYAQNSSPLYTDQRKAWKQQISRDYEKVGQQDPRWDQHVKTLLAFQEQSDPGVLRDAADAALKAGCEDPAGLMVAALVFMPDSKSLELTKQAGVKLKGSKYSPNVRLHLRLLSFAIQAQFPDQRPSLSETMNRMLVDYLQVVSDPDLNATDQRMVYNDSGKVLGTLVQNREMELLELLEFEKEIDPWLMEMLSGWLHHRLAWRVRGSGYANGVSEQQWKLFRTKMAQAQSHWLKAWQMKPEAPEAPAELLRVAMAYQGAAGEDTRFWFEQAVAAQFDYTPAYESYLWSIRPRWGGSHQQMLAFGRECQATERYDTQVPWQFHEAVQDVALELGEDGTNIYKRLGIADDYLGIIRGYRDHSNDSEHHHFLDSQIVCVLLLSGRTTEATEMMTKLGAKLDERAFATFDANLASLLQSAKN